jgi:hypothetical protein
MSSYTQDNYEIEYFRTPRSNNDRIDHFAPSLQSLKAAQDIVRQYEKRRRAAAKSNRPDRRAVTPLPSARGPVITDNIIPFHTPVWARPSSRLVYSRHASPAYPPSSAPRARRASLQSQSRRLSRHIRVITPSPVGASQRDVCDDAQSAMLQNIGLIAIQGLAVVLGLSGLLVLLTLI